MPNRLWRTANEYYELVAFGLVGLGAVVIWQHLASNTVAAGIMLVGAAWYAIKNRTNGVVKGPPIEQVKAKFLAQYPQLDGPGKKNYVRVREEDGKYIAELTDAGKTRLEREAEKAAEESEAQESPGDSAEEDLTEADDGSEDESGEPEKKSLATRFLDALESSASGGDGGDGPPGDESGEPEEGFESIDPLADLDDEGGLEAVGGLDDDLDVGRLEADLDEQ